MKNSKLIVLTILITVLLSLSACQSNQRNIGYTAKMALTDKPDGWIYYFDIETTKNKDTSNKSTYDFDGVNLKYKTLPGYTIPVRDSKTNKVIKTLTPSIMMLANSQEIGDEVRKVKEFFEAYQFDAPITIADIAELDISNLDKSEIVELFNQAITKEDRPFGKYYGYPNQDVVQGQSSSGYYWQIGYLLNYGAIERVNIEIIYNDGTHQSDNISDINNFIESIEEYIIKNQIFSLNDMQLTSFENIDFTRLNDLLLQIENKTEIKR